MAHDDDDDKDEPVPDTTWVEMMTGDVLIGLETVDCEVHDRLMGISFAENTEDRQGYFLLRYYQ